jgi:hypothetical protein
MDCEKFDKIVLDLLYQELDELGTAAAERHLEQCARCREIYARLRATRDIGSLPLVEPPQGFEHRVLAQEALLLRAMPLRQRAGRAVSKLADYAMRPQLAMAALLMLMIGSSLIFLRAKPGEQSSVQVTERGMPETEADSIILPSPAAQSAGAPRQADGRFAMPPPAAAPAAPAATVAANPTTLAQRAEAKTEQPLEERARTQDKAAESSMAKRSAGAELGPSREHDDLFGLEAEEPEPASVALQQAKQLQQSSGCSAAAPKFDEVNTRFPGSPVAAEATWRAAECRRLLGEIGAARQGYLVLLEVNAYRERARAALSALGGDPNSDTAVASKPASKPATSSPAGAAAEPAAPPAKAKAKAEAEASPPAAASPPRK